MFKLRSALMGPALAVLIAAVPVAVLAKSAAPSIPALHLPVTIDATRSATAADKAGDFEIVYPGKLTAHEKAPVEKYYADNAALQARGGIDVQALINGTLPKDTPGIGPVIKVTRDWVLYNNNKLDPENPLRHDSDYAKSEGFDDVLAYFTFGANDDTYMVPYPGDARDKLLVSDLNHVITSYAPIYPGDTLYLVMNERTVTDMTPVAGSTFRSLAIVSKGSIYNQKGVKVNDVIFRVTESVEVYKDAAKRPANPGFFDMWVAPDWMKRPEHTYSDVDWSFIRKVWAGEKVRGAAPLYWEDVKVGDKPAWTLEGPIQASVSPVRPWGQGSGGSRTLKKEITDPETFRTLIRNPTDGIYRLPNPEDAIPKTPDDTEDKATGTPVKGEIDTTQIHKAAVKRSPLVNYMGRDFAIRMLTNYMGDQGWIETIRWSIMDPRADLGYGVKVPVDPAAEHWLDEVPAMKGRHLTAHGLTKDVAIVKSEVVSKYARDGRFYVDIVWWIETIDGYVWEEGKASVRLPSKP
jgi:hypothetical protein